MYRIIVLILLLIAVCIGSVFIFLQEKWEASPVFTYQTVDAKRSLQTYYGVGREKEMMAIGSLAYYENGQNTWLFWGEYEELIGQDVQIYAEKQDGQEKVKAVKEDGLSLKKGIWGADAHVEATVELPETGLWKIVLKTEKKKLGEIVVKIDYL
ncbi:MAG TPA: hypothetical protein VNM45_07885 [Bacillus sp. (in: firmicutes)]|nr:hypothetical protein [Bacillus sp. (in: firmicutes)]